MKVEIDLSPEILSEAISRCLIRGEMGEKLADRIALIYAEIKTFNKTEAAKVLNVGRTTLYEYEIAKEIVFNSDGRISLLALLNFSKKKNEQKADVEKMPKRKCKRQRRTF